MGHYAKQREQHQVNLSQINEEVLRKRTERSVLSMEKQNANVRKQIAEIDADIKRLNKQYDLIAGGHHGN